MHGVVVSLVLRLAGAASKRSVFLRTATQSVRFVLPTGDPAPLFEGLFLISWEDNRDCHITMPLSLKTMEVQIKGDQ